MTIPIDTQKEWASWKYQVMSRSQQHYTAVRNLFATNQWDETKEVRFHHLLLDSQEIAPTVGTLTNAYQHVWGYFKRIATSEERLAYSEFLNTLTVADDQLLPFLQKLTLTYDVTYLKASRLLFPVA